MTAPATPSAPSTILDRAARLAEALASAHHEAGGRPQSVVVVHDLCHDHPQLDLGAVGPGGVHDAVFGWVAPADADGVGLVVSGRAHGPEVEPHAQAVVLCLRDGSMASALRLGDAEPVVTVDPGGDTPVGVLADALRRALGLPTPPPGRPVADVDSALWLHRVLEVAVDGVEVGVELVDSLEPPVPLTWEALREQTAEGAWSDLGVDPTLARWCDVGLFARLVLGSFPEPEQLLAVLSDLVDPIVFAHLVGRTVPPRW